MNKIKLLKTLGCVALIATPIITAPIILATSCSSTDPTPEIKVESIDKIQLIQNGKVIVLNPITNYLSGVFNYDSSVITTDNPKPQITCGNINVSFFINGNNEKPVEYAQIMNQTTFEFICAASPGETAESYNIFELVGSDLTTSSEAWIKAYESGSNSPITIDSNSRYTFNGVLKLSYGLKTSDDREIVALNAKVN